MKKISEVVGAVVLVALLTVVVTLLAAIPFQLLWNGCFVGAVDSVQDIGFLQAWGLQILAWFIFHNSTGGNKK